VSLGRRVCGAVGWFGRQAAWLVGEVARRSGRGRAKPVFEFPLSGKWARTFRTFEFPLSGKWARQPVFHSVFRADFCKSLILHNFVLSCSTGSGKRNTLFARVKCAKCLLLLLLLFIVSSSSSSLFRLAEIMPLLVGTCVIVPLTSFREHI